uniref:Uncharacterized protein n=1 Tax=Oryza rufipogon TaxID=4529 RepID=A0A0E0QSB5_ORYRU
MSSGDHGCSIPSEASVAGDTIYLLPMPCRTSSPCWPLFLRHDAADPLEENTGAPSLGAHTPSTSPAMIPYLHQAEVVVLSIHDAFASSHGVILMPTTTVSHSSASTAR